jgi:sirohydrochlorin ferrochelatase
MGSVRPVKVEGAELLTVELPLVTPFRTSYATTVVERKLLVLLRTDAGTGWGECGAPAEPLYTSEYGDAARHVVVHHLLPRLAEAGEVTPDDVATALAPVQGHRMAKAAHLIMVPFFISDGLHSYEDIPVMLGETAAVVQERLNLRQPTWRNPTARQGKLLWYTMSIGSEPHIADVILERIQEAESRG